MTTEVCFQFVTKGRAVINSSPEPQPSMAAALEQAKTWMGFKGQTLSFTTWDGGGAVVRVDEVEHIAVLTPEQMARLHADDDHLVHHGYTAGLRAALQAARSGGIPAVEQLLTETEPPR